MFFTSKIEIDPSQITVIKRIKNVNPLNKLLDKLSKKFSDDQIELETFTVVSILAQIRDGLLNLGMDNIIRLSINGFDFYLDTEEKEKDLNETFKKLSKKINPIESERFEFVELVIEHEDPIFKYYISIDILRKHKVGEYPVKIIANGLIKKFASDSQIESEVKERMNRHFISQQDYEIMLKNLEMHFSAFVNDLERTLAEFINSDGFRSETFTKIIRPSLDENGKYSINYNYKSEPAFHGYAGAGKYLTYTLFWVEHCLNHGIICKNFTMVDSYGRDSLKFGDISISASTSTLFNLDSTVLKDDLKDAEIIEDGEYGELTGKKSKKYAYTDFEYSSLKIDDK